MRLKWEEGPRYAGESAVPCNPQSAIAGANSLAEAVVFWWTGWQARR